MVGEDTIQKEHGGFSQNIVVLAGTWICSINGTWDFKIDKLRMGRSVDCSKISRFLELQAILIKEYNVDGMGVSIDITYMGGHDVLGELSEVARKPTTILDDQGFENFRSIQKVDGSVNLFATFKDIVDDETCIVGTSATHECSQAKGYKDLNENFGTMNKASGEDDVYDYWHELINIDHDELVPSPKSDTDDVLNPCAGNKSKRKNYSDLCGTEWGQEIDEGRAKEVAESLKKCTREITATDIYGFDDVEPMFDSMANHTFSVDNFDLSVEDDEIYVGRLFNNKEELKIAMSIYAIKRVFRFKITRCAKDYIVMQCVDQKCDWRVYAHQFGKSERYEVRKAHLDHVCSTESRFQVTKHATSKVVAALLRSKYGNISNGPRARDLPEMVLAEHNVSVSYWKCWKARELAISKAQGTEEKSYMMLPLYLHVLKISNPGTICHIKSEADTSGTVRFKYVFMSLGASIKGVENLRRVIVMDGTHLHGKYKGCLLTASGQDANFQIFPIAFAVVDSENDASWSWFLEKLKEIIGDGRNLVFVTDRQSSIYTAISSHYPLSHHGACLVHLGRNISSNFKGKYLVDMVTRAGEAFRVSSFRKIYKEIKVRNEECWKYLEKIGVQHWTKVYFPGMRYNLMSSNVAESVNNALTPARDCPIVSLLEFIRKMLSRWFHSRRTKAASLNGDIPPEIEKSLIKNLEDSAGLSVFPASNWNFEVIEKQGGKYHVDLQNKSCTCQVFDKFNIPCCHAIAAIGKSGLKCCSFVDELYKKNRWASTYEGVVLPVPDPQDQEIPSELKEVTLLPPKTRRPSGRPPKKRILSQGEFKVRKKTKIHKCSRCGESNHNRVTCKRPI